MARVQNDFLGLPVLVNSSFPIHAHQPQCDSSSVKSNKPTTVVKNWKARGSMLSAASKEGNRAGSQALCYEIPSSGVRTSSAWRKDGKLRLKARQRGDSFAELRPSVYSRIIGVMVKRWMFNIS